MMIYQGYSKYGGSVLTASLTLQDGRPGVSGHLKDGQGRTSIFGVDAESRYNSDNSQGWGSPLQADDDLER